MIIALLPIVAGSSGSLVATWPWRGSVARARRHSVRSRCCPWPPLAVGLVAWPCSCWLVRLLGVGLEAGHLPDHSRRAWQAWATMRVLDEARTWLFPLYSSALDAGLAPAARRPIGREVEASTVLLIPKLTSINDEAFLADDTLLGSYELGGGWLRVERTKIGKRAFVGNSGMTAPGRKVPKQSLVAVLSAAPRRKKAKAGSVLAGQPAGRCCATSGRGRRQPHLRTARRLRVARGLVECCRLLAVMRLARPGRSVVLGSSSSSDALVARAGGAPRRPGPDGRRALAAGLTSAVKWVLVGRHPPPSTRCGARSCGAASWPTPSSRWSPPRGSRGRATGTPVLNLWLRSLGARVGRGVWCETYWLPEPDLVELRDGVTVNKGCVVQTHLFHDRVLSMDRVVLAPARRSVRTA